MKSNAGHAEFDDDVDQDRAAGYGQYGKGGGNFGKRKHGQNHQFNNVGHSNFLNEFGKEHYNANNGKRYREKDYNRDYGLDVGNQNNRGDQVRFAQNNAGYNRLNKKLNRVNENEGRLNYGNTHKDAVNIAYTNNQKIDRGNNHQNLVRVKRNQDYAKAHNEWNINYQRHKDLGQGKYY